MIKIFISHCAEDSAIAESLADLFHTALHLSKSEIRCTSVDGYRLPAGASTDEQLRREVLDAPVLVGLISHHSFDSAYVLFELGARWGKNAFMAPLLVPGVSTSVLKGPISSLNALSCESASQIYQLVHELGLQLGVSPEPPATYAGLVDNVAKSGSVARSASHDTASSIPSSVANPTVEDDYPGADQIIADHCEDSWPDDYQMRVYCEDEQRKAVEGLRQQSHDDIPTDIFQRIRSSAAQQWPEDLQMRLYTEGQQLEAYRKLQRSKSSKGGGLTRRSS
jgi:hypothetical protein